MADYTQALRSLMEQADIPSFRELAERANVSLWPIRQLRQGQASQIRLGTLMSISQALNISIETLVGQCSEVSISASEQTTQPDQKHTNHKQPDAGLYVEYQRLQKQLDRQEESLQNDFQRASLQRLESWMTYWPAAVYATQAKPDLPATRLIPLVRPVEQLLDQWGVEAIASVGSEVPYDPQQHQLVEGQAAAGETVRISNPGYTHNGALLQRAKVKPIK